MVEIISRIWVTFFAGKLFLCNLFIAALADKNLLDYVFQVKFSSWNGLGGGLAA